MAAGDALVQLAVEVIAAALFVGVIGIGLLVGAVLVAAIGAGSREFVHDVPIGVLSHEAWLSRRLRLRYGTPPRGNGRRVARAVPFEQTVEDAPVQGTPATPAWRPVGPSPALAVTPLAGATGARPRPRRMRRSSGSSLRPAPGRVPARTRHRRRRTTKAAPARG